MAELDPERVGETVVLRLLPDMEAPRSRSRASFSASSAFGSQAGLGRRDVLRADPQAKLAEIDPVEFQRQLDQRRIAARGDIGHDGARRA